MRSYDEIRAEVAEMNAALADGATARECSALLLNLSSDVPDLLAALADAEDGLQKRLFDECATTRWDPELRNTFGEECAHLHEEITEAFKEWRVRKDAEIWYEEDGKPHGVPIELADVLIGLFYNAEVMGFDLLDAVEIKHRWNLTRDYQAEGRALHPLAAVPLSQPAPDPGETVVRYSRGHPITAAEQAWDEGVSVADVLARPALDEPPKETPA